jgi:hypothetical protein
MLMKHCKDHLRIQGHHACEVSLPRKKRLNQHRKLCHFTPLKINDDNYDSDDSAFMGGFNMMEYDEDTAPSVNMVEVATTAAFLESTHGRQESDTR